MCCKARVVAFSCFRPVPPCYRRPNRVARATPPARISRFHPAGYGKRETQGLWPAACFSPVIYREIQEARGAPTHVAVAAADHYLTRIGGGAVEGLILHGVVATFQKPHARGRARASRLRAAGGARPMQGRGADVVEHARALHH